MDAIDEVLGRLGGRDAQVGALLEIWRGPGHVAEWRRDPRLYRGFARALVSAGQPIRAYELGREGLIHHPNDPELTYVDALALARAKSPSTAWAELGPLLAVIEPEHALYMDVQSLAGRIKKDLRQLARDAGVRQSLARESARAYESAYELTKKSYPAINAATMWRLAGKQAKSGELARAALDAAGRESDRPGAEADYWLMATVAEARLILDDAAGAAEAYGKAVSLAGRRFGDIASMRTNVMLLAEVMPVPDELRGIFRIGGVVVFSGHMIDHPDRPSRGLGPRFPPDPALERRVAAAIRSELDALDVVAGYGSVACGADILFGEQILDRDAELHVVLPFSLADFRKTSVDFGVDEMRSWRTRCDAVLSDATEVHYATREPFLGSHELFGFGDSIARGLAIDRAAQLGVDPLAIALVDPASPVAPDGAAMFAQNWEKDGRRIRRIDLSSLRTPTTATPGARPTAPPAAPTDGEPRHIKAMLFSDVKNFSKLPEERAPKFFPTFMGEVDGIIQRSPEPNRPVFQNTWGDGLYLVFDRVVDCAVFALSLLDRVATVDWRKLDLPEDTTVRMGLHVGPVYSAHDPIIKATNFFGSHVNRAARIEPVTPPGCAFASEQFAAALAAQPGHDLACDYVGVQALAREYDHCALYRLRRSRDLR